LSPMMARPSAMVKAVIAMTRSLPLAAADRLDRELLNRSLMEQLID
jgi:hypothetical protein